MIGYRYTDVTLELKPLDKGHMLMLEYDLVLASPAKLLSLAELYSEKGKLRELLTAWNDAVTKESTTHNDSLPTLLAHVCESIYKSPSLSLNKLEDNDRFRVAYLSDICSRLDMGLYIADLDRTLTGFCESRYNQDEDYDMGVEDEDFITLTKMVDLDGNIVAGRIPLDAEDNFVASDPFDEVPDSRDFDRNHGVVTYYYRRTVSIEPGLDLA